MIRPKSDLPIHRSHVACATLSHDGVLSTFAASIWKQSIVVGSKNFMENRLLAEMFAQLIEARSPVTVTRTVGIWPEPRYVLKPSRQEQSISIRNIPEPALSLILEKEPTGECEGDFK